MKFPVLEKFVYLMKDSKYEHQSIFPLWGGSNLILGIGRENQIFFSKNFSHCQVLSPNCQKMTLWYKKNHYPPRWICITDIWSLTLFPRNKNKINFFDEISSSRKNFQFNEGPKILTSKHFLLVGKGQT